MTVILKYFRATFSHLQFICQIVRSSFDEEDDFEKDVNKSFITFAFVFCLQFTQRVNINSSFSTPWKRIFLFECDNPRPLFNLFSVFSNSHTIFQQINVKIIHLVCVAVIRTHDLFIINLLP